MKKKLLILPISGFFLLVSLALLIPTEKSEGLNSKNESETPLITDIIMPSKSSRPGCEETNSCYIPHIISIKKGAVIIWKNEDVAFHSVTSGIYGKPDGLFDSGHLDPYQSFSFKFKEEGNYDYFCTLHPWMKGKIIVE